MISKSKTINENLNSLFTMYTQNSKSFSDFEKLILGGTQKILTFGEYSNKKNNNKKNKRKIIYYFYKRIDNNINIRLNEYS